MSTDCRQILSLQSKFLGMKFHSKKSDSCAIPSRSEFLKRSTLIINISLREAERRFSLPYSFCVKIRQMSLISSRLNVGGLNLIFIFCFRRVKLFGELTLAWSDFSISKSENLLENLLTICQIFIIWSYVSMCKKNIVSSLGDTI